MATLYGLNGLIRGRQGNNVYSVQSGTQVLKVYNPVVFNPRTLSQREQRVKFALAGKMSSCTPSEALIGLNRASKRDRRAAFVSSLARIATVSGTIDNLVASVPYEEVIYSEGSVPMWSNSPTITAVSQQVSGTGARRVSVTVQARSSVTGSPEGYGELVIAALYDVRTSALDEVQVQERVLGQVNNMLFRQGTARDCHVAVYIVPFIRQESTSRPFTDNLADTDSSVTLTAVSGSRLSSADFGRSVYLGVYPVLGAAQSTAAAPSDDEFRSVAKKK